MSDKLDSGQKHLLSLIVKGQDSTGWAPVSAPVFPLLKQLPSEIIELESVGDEGRGRVRLTDKGQSVIDAMLYL